jgi:hypothetical protein
VWAWTGSIWLRKGTGDGHLWVGSIKCKEFVD